MDTVSAILSKSNEGPRNISQTNALMLNSFRKKESGRNEIPKNVGKTIEASEIKEDTDAKVKRISEALESYVRSADRDLKIQVHGATGDLMVKVISGEDGRVIREIPPKELLDLAAKLEKMTGALFNNNA